MKSHFTNPTQTKAEILAFSRTTHMFVLVAVSRGLWVWSGRRDSNSQNLQSGNLAFYQLNYYRRYLQLSSSCHCHILFPQPISVQVSNMIKRTDFTAPCHRLLSILPRAGGLVLHTSLELVAYGFVDRHSIQLS